MRVSRILRMLLPFVLVLAVVAVGVAVFTARPDQQGAKRNVDRTWTPLANDLKNRYYLLTAADDKVRALSGPVHEIAENVHDALTRWQTVATGRAVESQVFAANTLEALGGRLVAAARDSDRVKANHDATAAVEAFAGDHPSAARVETFNDAVQKYARERRGPVRGLVAGVFGGHDISAFEPATV
jgi:hypothetical protein